MDSRLDSRYERASTPKETIFCPHCEQYLRKKTYRRHKFLYFDDVAEKWTRTQSQAHGGVGDDEAFDEVDFLADQEPTEMNMTRITEKKKEEPPIVTLTLILNPMISWMLTLRPTSIVSQVYCIVNWPAEM